MFGGGAAGPRLETEMAFILAMMSGFSGVAPPLEDAVEVRGGFPRAALRAPSGVEEEVMLETVGASELLMLRGDRAGGAVGLPRGGDWASESGEVGGDSREGASSSSSGEDMMGGGSGVKAM